MVEILTVQEVATLLKLHPRTVMKMATEGKLPAAKVGRKWRFERGRIETWLESQMDASAVSSSTANQPMTGEQLLPVNRTLILNNTNLGRDELLKEMALRMNPSGFGSSLEDLTFQLKEREEMYPTAMEYGVAFPHPRHPLASLPAPALTLAVVPEGLDFGAPRGEKTFIFVLVCAPDDRSHLSLLSRVARTFRTNGLVGELRQCTTPEQVRDLFLKTESTVLADQIK